MVARNPVVGARGKTAGTKAPRPKWVVVEEEERRHLVEDCAFFRAARFRAARPGSYREQDLKAAAAAIDAAIKPDRKRRKSP
jgi:hypothetical protein